MKLKRVEELDESDTAVNGSNESLKRMKLPVESL